MNQAGTGLAKVALIALMAVGSIFLWIGIPVGMLWIGSQIQSDSGQASFGLYMGILLGIVVSMVVVGKALSKLNRAYAQLMGTTSTVRMRSSWMKSMRGERDSGRPRSVLDVVMVWSVALALLCFGVWFFAFAGSSLPT